MTLEELRRGRARRDRHGAAGDHRHAGPPAGQAPDARHFLDEVAEHGAEGCNYLLAVDVEMNTVEGYAMSSWERGYGDFVMRPDLDTCAPVPWQEGTAMCLADVAWEDGADVVASPRQVLRRQLARLAERGWTRERGHRARVHRLPRHLRGGVAQGLPRPRAGQPLQRRLLAARHRARRAADPPHPQRDGARAGMVVEDSKGECNLGQHEINFRYADALRDRRRARDLQERRQGDRRPGGHGDQLHGQVRRARGQLVPHPLLAGRRRRAAVRARPRAVRVASWPASSPACAS